MISRNELKKQIESLGIPYNSALLMHTSLRAVGEIDGGGEALLCELIGYCKSVGTLLCIPTHTWHRFSDGIITLDVRSDDICIGTLPMLAVRRGDGVRSLNPSHSMVVFGDSEKVRRFASLDDTCETSTAPSGCHGELCRMDGAVLLAGVGLEKCTYMHSVEEMLDVPDRLNRKTNALVKLEDGKIVSHPCWGICPSIGDVSRKFPKFEPAFRKYNGIKDGTLGNAKTMLCDCRVIAEVMKKVRENSGGRELLADYEPLKPEWY